jgi:hypothetical protein
LIVVFVVGKASRRQQTKRSLELPTAAEADRATTATNATSPAVAAPCSVPPPPPLSFSVGLIVVFLVVGKAYQQQQQ